MKPGRFSPPDPGTYPGGVTPKLMNVRRTIGAVSLASLACVVALASGIAPASAQPKKAPQLRILVSNDDGYAAPGISAMVEALRTLPNTKVTVVAPAENQSGSGDTTSNAELVGVEAETLDGYPATSVAGTPADSVNYALDHVLTGKKAPNLMISGSNSTQNLGGFIDASGTVGAARTAARAGIPALAVSSGVADQPDYDAAAREVVRWVKRFRKALAKDPTPTTTVENLNVPTCTSGHVRGLVEVPAATTVDGALQDQDCTSTLENPTTDIEAFNNGFAAISEISF